MREAVRTQIRCIVYATLTDRPRFHFHRIMTGARTQLRAICRTYRSVYRERPVRARSSLS